MAEVTISGDDLGIKLWNLISESTDPEEMRYRELLNKAAVTYGKICFTDLITQREERRNQTSWWLEWVPAKSTWKVSLFMVPEGATRGSKRLLDPVDTIDIDDTDWEDIDPNDVVSL